MNKAKITSPNKAVYAHRPVRAVRATKNRSRRKRLCAVLSPPHLGQGSLLRNALLPAPNVVNSQYVRRNKYLKNDQKSSL